MTKTSFFMPASSNGAVIKFQTSFLEQFQQYLNNENWLINADFVSKALTVLYEMEERGIRSGIGCFYYNAYNAALIKGFERAFNKNHKLTYMGYRLIRDTICIESCHPDYQSGRSKKAQESPYRVDRLHKEFLSELDSMFMAYTVSERETFEKQGAVRSLHDIKSLDIKGSDRKLYPGTLNILSSANKGFNIRPFESSKYMTFPVWERGHLTDVDEDDNITVFIQNLIQNFGKKGGCSALLEAGVGTGKTYAVAGHIAPLLGRILGTEVSMLMPTTPQIAQTHEQYGANTNYGATTNDDREGSDCITAVIYDKADEIAEVTPEGRPVVLIIDEAHMLFTDEGYRSTAMKKIKKTAGKILEMGGIVLSMTASSEIVASTMPYNSARGYDLVAVAYRVTSKAPVNGIPYPNYEYADVIRYGKRSGVEIVSAIPADDIEVVYRATNAPVEKYIIQAVKNEVSQKMLVVIENNDKDSNQKIATILSGLNIKVGLISADDKGYAFSATKGCRVYNNLSYEDIVNGGFIDRDKVQVLITTKLLENGTSISHIKKDKGTTEDIALQQYNVSTYHVVKRRQDFDVQAFEQFSGRIRCRHKKACLMLPHVPEANRPYYGDLDFYIKRLAGTKIRQLDALSKTSVDESRLNFVDLADTPDFEDDVLSGAGVSAEMVSKTVFKALKSYYKSLMYNKTAFEMFFRERYITKNISFKELHEPDIDVERGRQIVEAAFHGMLSATIKAAYANTKESDTKKKIESSADLSAALNQVARGSYKDNIRNIMEVRSVMEDIQSGKIPAKNMKPEQIKLDTSKCSQKQFLEAVESCAVSTAKKDSGAMLNDINMSFLLSIIDVKGMTEIIKRLAYRRSRHDDYETSVFIDDAINLMGISNFSDEARIRDVLMQLVHTDKFQAILSIISTCGFLICDISELCRFASKNSYDKLSQVTLCYDFFTMANNEKEIHREFTSSGREFSILLSKECYDACEFSVPFNNKGGKDMYAWVNKTMDIEKFLKLASILQKNMAQNGDKAPSDLLYLTRRILHIFATVFHVKQHKKDDTVVYLLCAPRKRYPSDFTRILSYNFKTLASARTDTCNIFSGINKDNPGTAGEIFKDLDPLESDDVFSTADGFLAREVNNDTFARKKYFAVYAPAGEASDNIKALGYHESDMSGNVLSTSLSEDNTVDMQYLCGSDRRSFVSATTVIRYVMTEEDFKSFCATDMSTRTIFNNVLSGHYQMSSDYKSPYVHVIGYSAA